MTYTSRCTIGFMIAVFISSFGCKSGEHIERHLQNLNAINSNISTGKWSVFDGFVDEHEEHFELERQKADTSYFLAFSYFPISEKYIFDGFYQSFIADGHYHEMSIHNNDTMYYFVSTVEQNKRQVFSFEDRHFIVGKYYFLNQDGWLNEKQMEYFELHKDSLIKVRGNEIADLPGAE